MFIKNKYVIWIILFGAFAATNATRLDIPRRILVKSVVSSGLNQANSPLSIVLNQIQNRSKEQLKTDLATIKWDKRFDNTLRCLSAIGGSGLTYEAISYSPVLALAAGCFGSATFMHFGIKYEVDCLLESIVKSKLDT